MDLTKYEKSNYKVYNEYEDKEYSVLRPKHLDDKLWLEYLQNRKYAFIDDSIEVDGHVLNRFVSLKNFELHFPFEASGYDKSVLQEFPNLAKGVTLPVQALDLDQYGTIGGYIEDDKNLSQEGKAWIEYGAKVYNGAVVQKNGIVSDNSIVCGKSVVEGIVAGETKLSADIRVAKDEMIIDNVKMKRENKLVNLTPDFKEGKSNGLKK